MKPILNPSRLKAMAQCWFRYWVNYVMDLEATDNFAHKREFGTYVHEAEAAHDEMKNVGKALIAQTRKFKREPWYNPMLTKALAQLEKEAMLLHNGHMFKNAKGEGHVVESYEDWAQKYMKNSEVVAVEERLFVDLGPVMVAPKLDFILKTYGWFGSGEELWVVDRKTTERWDDKNWQWRWTLDGQTTIQALALESKFGKEIAGVMIEPIQITRQHRKGISDPQPIGKAQRLPMKWVRKPRAVLDDMMFYLEDIKYELQMRHEQNNWPKNGAAGSACDFCKLKKLCKGEIDMNQLHNRKPDEVDDFEAQKARKK